MNYTQDQLIRLMEEVEFQSGRHIDKDCTPDIFRMRSRPGGPERNFRTQACGNATLFEIPYARAEGGTTEMETLVACAVCDNMGLWPRFAHIFEEGIEP